MKKKGKVVKTRYHVSAFDRPYSLDRHTDTIATTRRKFSKPRLLLTEALSASTIKENTGPWSAQLESRSLELAANFGKRWSRTAHGKNQLLLLIDLAVANQTLGSPGTRTDPLGINLEALPQAESAGQDILLATTLVTPLGITIALETAPKTLENYL